MRAFPSTSASAICIYLTDTLYPILYSHVFLGLALLELGEYDESEQVIPFVSLMIGSEVVN